VKAGHLNAVASGAGIASMTATTSVDASMTVSHVEPATDMKFCAIDNPDCEACQ
jgi:ribonucleoside-diphosphate reductase alpha chain